MYKQANASHVSTTIQNTTGWALRVTVCTKELLPVTISKIAHARNKSPKIQGWFMRTANQTVNNAIQVGARFTAVGVIL